MNALTPTRLVHHFDIRLRRIACGLHGYDHRSTKHVRSVTCDACIGVLRERPTHDDEQPRDLASRHEAASLAP